MNPVSIVLLVIFGISVIVTYLTVRRTQMNIVLAGIVGSLVDVILFALYSLSAGNPPVQAALVGFVLGVLFNVMTVAAAAFFRQNTPAH